MGGTTLESFRSIVGQRDRGEDIEHRRNREWTRIDANETEIHHRDTLRQSRNQITGNLTARAQSGLVHSRIAKAQRLISEIQRVCLRTFAALLCNIFSSWPSRYLVV